MDKIRIVGVPEHFNYPWKKTVEEQPFKEEGVILDWTDEPGGSGAMNTAIREGNADVAIILTESYIKDRVEGNPGKIIGYHVQSPLVWGIHISSGFQVKEINELQGAPFLISRNGSGSHLMAFLLAKQNGWDLNQIEFEVVGNLNGAKEALKGESLKVFLWEKYTTMPLVKEGRFSRVGEIPTPWPCFVMVASPAAIAKHSQRLKKLRDWVCLKSTALSGREDLPRQLSEIYGIDLADTKEWLTQTQWATTGEIQKSLLENAVEVLKSIKLISREVAVEELVDLDFVTLV